jgi:hypothetical protein
MRVYGVLAARGDHLHAEELEAGSFGLLDGESDDHDGIRLSARGEPLKEIAAVLPIPHVIEEDVEAGRAEHGPEGLHHRPEEPAR